MGNENLLPKNIRQIGEIQGRQKICLEDYVVTYIRKIENRGDRNFLGIFLGEGKNTENADYVFVRGLMEVPDANELKRRKAAAEENEPNDRKTAAEENEMKDRKAAVAGKNVSGQKTASVGERAKIRSRKGAETNREAMIQISGKNTDTEKSVTQGGQNEAADKDILKEKIGLWEAFQRRYGTQEETWEAEKKEKAGSGENHTREALQGHVTEEKNAKNSGRMTESKNSEHGMLQEESLNAQKDPSTEAQDLWNLLQTEREERFPGCDILGCCVIGTYPAGRVEELSSHIPEAGQMLYHLQDQEERLYWRDGDRYEGVKGYFVFYEQNRQMQAYLAETFGGTSTEKEKVPDDAIRSFREKVKSKAQERSRSFLKLASSFFVVGVLIIGVIMVNRVADLRHVQSVAETVGVTSATGEIDSGQNDHAGLDSGESDMENADGADDMEADDVVTAGSSAANSASEGIEKGDGNVVDSDESATDNSNTITDNAEVPGSDTILTGSDAFWAEDESSSSSDVAAEASGSTSASDTAVNTGSVSASDAAGDSTGAVAGSSSEYASADTTASSDTAGRSDMSVTSDRAAGTTEETAAESDQGIASEAEDENGSTEASSRQVQAAYVIREGDTLAEICAKYYGSLDYLEALCEANEIEDANLILPGQKIVLP